MFVFYPGFNPKTDQGLFEKGVDGIVNTVNTKGTGKTSRGVAGQVFSAYDGVHKAYMDMCNQGKFFPGAIQMVETNPQTGARVQGSGFFVFNVATKDDWRNPSKLAWVEDILKKMPVAVERSGVKSLAIPPLGCGEGGLSWERDVGPLVLKHLGPLQEKGVMMHVFASDPDPSKGRDRSVPPSKNRKGQAVFLPQAVRDAMPQEKWYAGIGARPLTDKNPNGAPPAVLKKMEKIGALLAQDGWGLRSGAAFGSDKAFEDGARSVGSQKLEIYLPKNGFNGRRDDGRTVFAPVKGEINDRAEALARDLHPAGEKLSGFAMAAMTRNAYQLLGKDLETPSRVVVCYTKDGKEVGGTGQSLRMAKLKHIPVVNLGDPRLRSREPEQLVEVIKQVDAGKSIDDVLKGFGSSSKDIQR